MKPGTHLLLAGLLLSWQDVQTDSDRAPQLLHLLHREMHTGVRPTQPKDGLRRLSARDHGISEIALEHVPGHMPTSAFYSLVLRGSGAVELNATKVGQISSRQFSRLAWAIIELGYEDLAPTYLLPGAEHLPSVVTSIVRDGQRSIVRNDGNAGPARLWAIEQAIEFVGESVRRP